MSNKVVIITGSSRGIGAATAILAAQRGYTVCLNYLKDKASVDKVASIIRASGGTCLIKQADMSDSKSVKDLFNIVFKEYGSIYGVVNNVGIIQERQKFAEMSMSRISKTFQTNVMSTIYSCQEAITLMSLKHGGQGGCIVNVSSAASRLGSPNEYVDYAASKGAIDSLTIGLAKELAAEGIRVNCVRPGFIHTDIHSNNGSVDRIEQIAPTLPMQRGGNPEEVAEAILWLLSQSSSYVTGNFIDMAGGL